jgi:polysaccharide biosynthesis transport protein
MSDIVLSRAPSDRSIGDAHGLAPGEIVALLRRNVLLLVLCALVCAVGAYFGTSLLLPKQYSASGMLALDTQTLTIPALEGAVKGDVLPDPMPIVRSEVEELQSPALIRAVVQDLKLEQDPEFNGTLRPPGLIDRLMQRVMPHAAPSAPPSQHVIDELTQGAVRSHLTVSNDGQSLVIIVQFMAGTPEQAAAVVNSLIQHYMAAREAARRQVDQQANAALTQRLNQVRDDVNALENRIQQTRQRYELVQTRAGSVSQQQLEDLSSALTRASADRAALEANYSRANALANAGGVSQDSAQVLGSATISTLRDREAAAERQVAQLSQTYGPGYPALRAAQAELGSARGALAAEAHRVVVALGAEVQAARQREADLRQQLAAAQTKASQVATVQADLQQLEKDADARRALYQTLLVSAEQTETTKQGPRQIGSHVVSLATPPVLPSSPRPKLAAAFGLVGGFAFGGLLAFFRRTGEVTFADAEELAAVTGLDVLPSIPRTRRGRALAETIATDPGGAEAEAMRAIRTRLRFLGNGPMPRSLLFLSSMHGEGSSSVAASFARGAAADGVRVLLVEGDLASPSLAQLLDVSTSGALVEVLHGQEDWREAVARDSASPLDALLASAEHPADGRQSAQLVESMQLQNVLVEARDDYGLVVLDGPPITETGSAAILARSVDAVILIVQAGVTTQSTLLAALAALGPLPSRPPLLLLNGA